jgi:hypothetical protein
VLEDSGRRIQARLLDIDHEFGGTVEPERCVFYVAPGFALTDSKAWVWLEHVITTERRELVFLDTSQRATPGVGSFDDEKQGPILHRLANDLTRRLGVTLVIFEHFRLYLATSDRTNWPQNILFVEPPGQVSRMTVVSVAVVKGHDPVAFAPQTHGVVLAVLPLGDDRTVQLVATHESIGDVISVIEDGFRRSVHRLGGLEAIPNEGVFFVMGERSTDIPWVSAVRFRKTDNNEIVSP